jgi:hypothetical protein
MNEKSKLVVVAAVAATLPPHQLQQLTFLGMPQLVV